jgi:hypothetical protein
MASVTFHGGRGFAWSWGGLCRAGHVWLARLTGTSSARDEIDADALICLLTE